VDENPFYLIDNAVATVTVSGTIGWESVIRGTPTIIFGRAWYEDMIGVFKIKSKRDLQDNWSTILDLKNNIMMDDILDYHKKLQNYLISAPHYKAFVGKVARSDIENTNNIYNGICNHLTKIGYMTANYD
jgi:capsule polysaccharide modification protein KpsS